MLRQLSSRFQKRPGWQQLRWLSPQRSKTTSTNLCSDCKSTTVKSVFFTINRKLSLLIFNRKKWFNIQNCVLFAWNEKFKIHTGSFWAYDDLMEELPIKWLPIKGLKQYNRLSKFFIFKIRPTRTYPKTTRAQYPQDQQGWTTRPVHNNGPVNNNNNGWINQKPYTTRKPSYTPPHTTRLRL